MNDITLAQCFKPEQQIHEYARHMVDTNAIFLDMEQGYTCPVDYLNHSEKNVFLAMLSHPHDYRIYAKSLLSLLTAIADHHNEMQYYLNMACDARFDDLKDDNREARR